LAAISERHPDLAAVDPFRPGRSILLRRCGCSQSRQGVAIIPGHPLRRTLLQFRGVPQQFGQIVERIGAVELARMNQAHEQITDPGAVQCLIEERVLACRKLTVEVREVRHRYLRRLMSGALRGEFISIPWVEHRLSNVREI